MKLIFIKPQKVILGKDLFSASPELMAAMKTVFVDSLLPFCLSTPPIMVNYNGSITLVERHFSFALLVEHLTLSSIPCMLVEDEDVKPFFESTRILEKVIIKQAESLKKKTQNASGVSRKERKELGYVCPFCGLLLKGPKGHKPISEGKFKGYYYISCFSQQSKDSPCGFQAFLSQEEYILFSSRKYPTYIWLQKTESICPHCQKYLFLRTRFTKKMLLCEDNFKVNGTCKYRSEQGSEAPK